MISRLILETAGLFVPRPERAEWLAEWRAELWYVRQKRIRFCLGAFRDAFWIRRASAERSGLIFVSPHSPWRCISSLLIFAAVSAVFAVCFPAPPGRTLAHVVMIAVSFMILPSTTPLELGEYPQSTHFGSGPMKLRWRAFLALKFALVIVISFCTFLNLAAFSSTPLQPHSLLVSYVAGLRWALIDQQKRCPVCLRILTNPTRIGEPSRNLLEWCGTELMCARGHGLLHVPDLLTSSFSAKRWIYFDKSWSGLFISQAETNGP